VPMPTLICFWVFGRRIPTAAARSDLFVILRARSSPAITFTATPNASTNAASSVASSDAS